MNAHGRAILRGADQRRVVADGGIVERGKHHELRAQGGLYSDLYNTQFAEQGNEANALP